MEMGQRVRHIKWWLVVALLLAGGVALMLWSGETTLSLTQEEIQSGVDAGLGKDFPVKGPAQAIVKSLRADSAKALIHDGRIDFLIDATGVLRNDKTFSVSVFAAGAPRYEDAAFYFEPEKIEVKNLAFAGATPGELIARFAERHGLRDPAEQFLEGEAKRLQQLVAPIAAGLAKEILAHRPIYRLRDDMKGMLIKSSLQTVRVAGDRLDITVKLLQFGARAMLGALFLIVAIALAGALLLKRAR